MTTRIRYTAVALVAFALAGCRADMHAGGGQGFNSELELGPRRSYSPPPVVAYPPPAVAYPPPAATAPPPVIPDR